jgi:hypothetical protein
MSAPRHPTAPQIAALDQALRDDPALLLDANYMRLINDAYRVHHREREREDRRELRRERERHRRRQPHVRIIKEDEVW